MPNFPFTWLNLRDGAIAPLAIGIGSIDTSFVLSSGAGIKFPASDFIVKIENEVLHVATRTVDACSGVTRGYDGTTPATHAADTAVVLTGGRALFQRIYDNLANHTHPKADIPDFSHNHAQGDITNLVADLAAKEPANANIQAHVISAHAPANAQANADITKAEIEAKLTGVITSHSHSGGSDPWTYVRLASDFPTSSATAVDVTGMSLTPTANLRYIIEGMFLLRTNTATVGPRPGIAWPTGMTDGVGMIDLTSSATARLLANGNINASMLSAVGGLPNNTQSYPASIYVTLIAGASPGSTFRIQLASETAGTTVTMKANSWFRWRTF